MSRRLDRDRSLQPLRARIDFHLRPLDAIPIRRLAGQLRPIRRFLIDGRRAPWLRIGGRIRVRNLAFGMITVNS